MSSSVNRYLQYTDPIARSITNVVYGYGDSENIGIANRQQRALELCLHGQSHIEEVTLNGEGCPIVTCMKVRSATEMPLEYTVTRSPNQQEYRCNCPDTWHPCKHSNVASLFQQGFTLAHQYRLTIAEYTDMIGRLERTHPFGVHERAALRVLEVSVPVYYLLLDRAAQAYYGATESYRATCFSALIDRVRWHYGAGYSGVMSDNNGEISSVLAGRPTLPVRWHLLDLRWYIVGQDDAEDTALTQTVLSATLPEWAARWHVPLDDPFPQSPVFEEEEEEGHYALS